MKLVVLTPHFAPDLAPTGTVISRIVGELAARDHRVEVITSLPWYRGHSVEPGWGGRLLRHEDTPWGRVSRIHPFPTADKRNVVRRLAGFFGFSLVATAVGSRGDDVDGVLALSPPLTLGLAGLAIARARHAPLVFNVQDVFPDVAMELGVMANPMAISVASTLERFCYRHADAVTVLAEDLRENVAAKTTDPSKVHVVPNFVDTDTIVPADKENSYRREFGLEGMTVIMYAGNIGLSQSLDLMIDAAAALAYEPDVVFVINGQGAKRDDLEQRARGLANVRFVDMQPQERLPEVLAAADIHVVALRGGLGRSSVPSKTYSILAAGRPLVASVDRGSEVARIVESSGAGIAVPPDDAEALTKAIRSLLDARTELPRIGAAARAYVQSCASPSAVAQAYEELFAGLTG